MNFFLHEGKKYYLYVILVNHRQMKSVISSIIRVSSLFVWLKIDNV